MPIVVSIVDDHQLAASGVKSTPEQHTHIEIKGVYHSGDALMKGLADNIPDVLLLDVLMPEQARKDLAPLIKERFPAVKLIALTSLDAAAMVSSMMRRGCSGYLLKISSRLPQGSLKGNCKY